MIWRVEMEPEYIIDEQATIKGAKWIHALNIRRLRLYQKRANIFLVFVFSIFIILNYIGFSQAFSLNYQYRISFWIGVVFWSLIGFFLDDFKVFFQKGRWFWVIILVFIVYLFLNLIKMRMFPILNEFGVSAGLVPLVTLLRGIYKEKESFTCSK